MTYTAETIKEIYF